ncbi:MAG: hypothetical protein Aurels2KO_21830 [Aureliella sp.]
MPGGTQITDVPLPEVKQDQFAIAYKAQMIDGMLLRSKPLEIAPLREASNGTTIAEIPTGAKKVQVNVQGGEVEFIVDGQQISGP